MKKAAITGQPLSTRFYVRLFSIPFFKLKKLAVFVFFASFLVLPHFAQAATFSSQLLNDTAFSVDTGESNQEFVMAVGNLATGTVSTGVQIQTASSNTAASSGFRIQLLEYPSEAAFDADPYGGFDNGIVANVANHAMASDASGMVTTLWNGGNSYAINGFPYFYAITVDWIAGSAPLSFVNLLGTQTTPGVLFLHKTAGTYATTTGSSLYYQLFSGSTPNAFFTPAPGFAGFASSTLATTCDNSFATTSGFLDSVGSSISNGFCRVGAFLFVPSPGALTQFSAYTSSFQQKIPFSYVYGFRDIVNGLSASSTANLPGVTIPFPAIGSTTAMGAFVPTSIVGLSTSTISTYLPESVRQGFLGLQRVALWLGLVYMFYRRIIPHRAHI